MYNTMYINIFIGSHWYQVYYYCYNLQIENSKDQTPYLQSSDVQENRIYCTPYASSPRKWVYLRKLQSSNRRDRSDILSNDPIYVRERFSKNRRYVIVVVVLCITAQYVQTRSNRFFVEFLFYNIELFHILLY